MLYLGIDQHRQQLTVNSRSEDHSVILQRQVSTAQGEGLCLLWRRRPEPHERTRNATATPPPRPPFQFGLPTLLLLFVVLGSSLGVFGGWGLVVFGLVVGAAVYLHAAGPWRSRARRSSEALVCMHSRSGSGLPTHVLGVSRIASIAAPMPPDRATCAGQEARARRLILIRFGFISAHSPIIKAAISDVNRLPRDA